MSTYRGICGVMRVRVCDIRGICGVMRVRVCDSSPAPKSGHFIVVVNI